MLYANELRVCTVLAYFVVLALGLLVATAAASEDGSSLAAVTSLGMGSVTFAAVAAPIAVKLARPWQA